MKSEEYALTLIGKGFFLDQPDEPGPVFLVEVTTYRMSRAAERSWQIPKWLGAKERARRRREAEAAARRYLKIGKQAKGWSFDPHREIKDVLTVVHTKKLARGSEIISRVLGEEG